MNEYWGIGTGYVIMVILAILVILVGVYYILRKKG